MAMRCSQHLPYLSVQFLHQRDVPKCGVHRKDTPCAGVKADVIGDRLALRISSIQGVHVRACEETQGEDLELEAQLLLQVAAASAQGVSYLDTEYAV